MSKKSKNKSKAKMYDAQLVRQMGIDPKSINMVRRYGVDDNCDSRKIKRIIQKNDRQDAITSFVWYNCPKGLTGEMIEKLLYNRGTCCLIYVGGKFYCLPYTLKSKNDTGIDCYSRYKNLTPVTLGSTQDMKGIFGNKTYEILYDIEEEFNTEEDISKKAVVLFDYSPETFANTLIPTKELNDVLIEIESRIIPYSETALLSKSGVKGVRCTSEQEAQDVTALNSSIKYGALNQELLFGITASQELQDFVNDNSADISQYLELFQSMENFRKSTHGISVGGLMQKQSHMLNKEAQMSQTNNIAQGNDKLFQRQWGCLIFYSLTGIPMWCDIKKTANPDDNATQMIDQNKGGALNDNNAE